MSSSNTLTLFNPSRLSTVHPFTISDNGGLGTQQTIMLYDNEGNAYFKNTNVQVNIGPARDTGVTVTIRNTYPDRYNFAVRQYNSIPDAGIPRKKQMRGGHFFMYRCIVILAILIAVSAAGVSVQIKPFVALNIGLSLIYIILSIYNIIIFKRNGNLFSDRMIHDNSFTRCNNYYTIPIHTSISESNVLANQHENIIAGLRNTYNHLSEIQIMVYHGDYVRRYTYFPRNIVKHLIIFSLVMLLGILLASMVNVST
jgi:hypothetical protein